MSAAQRNGSSGLDRTAGARCSSCVEEDFDDFLNGLHMIPAYAVAALDTSAAGILL